MQTFEPEIALDRLRIVYEVGRPSHPVTPVAVREWYGQRNRAPRFVAWSAESKLGFKAGIDELCWRDDEVEELALEWARPAKGSGFVSLTVERRHGAGEIALLAEPFHEESLHFFESLAVWLIERGYKLRRFDSGGDA